MNKNNQISKNFTVEEFTYSRKAIENGIDNMPGESQIAAIRLLITQLIQPLRDRLGEPIAITSGYRCPGVNRLVGGVVNSQHTRGEAADCYAACGPERLLEVLIDSGLSFDQAIVYRKRNSCTCLIRRRGTGGRLSFEFFYYLCHLKVYYQFKM